MSKGKASVKPISPLQAMTRESFHQKKSIQDSQLDRPSLDSAINNTVLYIEPDDILNWEFSDRPEKELGDLHSLAEDLNTNGQIQPCVVRPHKNLNNKFELIVGERRWRSAKLSSIKLKVIVKNISDKEAAIIQASENANRKDLSDYAKGLNYSKLIESSILTRSDLLTKINKSKSTIRNMLSFSRIDNSIWEAINDPSCISAATAYEISRLLEKGPIYKEALLTLTKHLDGKNISDKKLRSLVERYVNDDGASPKQDNKAIEVKTTDQRHIFTWRNDTNGNRSISFPKDIRDIINFEQLEKILSQNIEQQLKLKSQPN